MAILNSCCCWKSVRRGSFAVAVYSMAYYSALSWFLRPTTDEMESVILQEGERRSQQEAVVGELSRTMFMLSLAGLVTCLLLLIGLCLDRAWLLLPWVVVQVCVILVDLVVAGYILWQMELASVAALTFTLDFFFMVLNVYAILCVASQYQEYKAGRGTARDEEGLAPPVILYTRQSTLNSGTEGSRRPGVRVSFNGLTPPSPSTNPGMQAGGKDIGGRSANFLHPSAPPLPSSPSRVDIRKQVQFPAHIPLKETEGDENNPNKEEEEEEEEEKKEEDKEDKQEHKPEEEEEEEDKRNRPNNTSSSSSLPPSSYSSPPRPPIKVESSSQGVMRF